MKPKPPASLTAAVSSGVDEPPASGARTIGCSSSSRIIRGILAHASPGQTSSPEAVMVPAVLEHNFSGTPFTLGIEEELMICDAETLELSQSIEVILSDLPDDLPGEVKPELMQSVLEVATRPCGGVQEAGDPLRELRRTGRAVAADNSPPVAPA